MGVNKQLQWNYYVNNNGSKVSERDDEARLNQRNTLNLFDLLFMHFNKKPRPLATLIPVYIFHTRDTTMMNK